MDWCEFDVRYILFVIFYFLDVIAPRMAGRAMLASAAKIPSPVCECDMICFLFISEVFGLVSVFIWFLYGPNLFLKCAHFLWFNPNVFLKRLCKHSHIQCMASSLINSNSSDLLFFGTDLINESSFARFLSTLIFALAIMMTRSHHAQIIFLKYVHV